MQLFHVSDYQYLLHLKKRYSWGKFRRKSRVAPRSYSETFTKRIYSSVFDYSVNLLEEFQKYYRDEYKNINQYLFWRHGVSEEILDQLNDLEGSYLAIFNYDWNLDDDDILKDSIIQLFQVVDGKG